MKLLALLQVAGNPVNGEAWSTRLDMSSMWVPDYWLICFGTTYKRRTFPLLVSSTLGAREGGPNEMVSLLRHLIVQMCSTITYGPKEKGLSWSQLRSFHAFCLPMLHAFLMSAFLTCGKFCQTLQRVWGSRDTLHDSWIPERMYIQP